MHLIAVAAAAAAATAAAAAGKYKVSDNCKHTWPKGLAGLCGDEPGAERSSSSVAVALCLMSQ
jgi:hypothetical protein